MRAGMAIPLAMLLAGCGGTPAATAEAAIRADLYQCEGCEGVLERDADTLAAEGRIGPADEPGERLLVSGTVFQPDRRTPARDVVIYAYQTNAEGRYANGSPESEWSRRHGRLRGWVKSGPDGRYSFRTIKPAPYPGETMPAHIHLTVLEPGRQAYWIDDIVFDGEFGVTGEYRAQMTDRGGNGIVPVTRASDGTLAVTRDIILERHPS